MKAILEIELAGDNVRQALKFWSGVADEVVPGLGRATFGTMPPCGWCAEVTGFDPKYKYARTFLRFRKDYSRANSKGSRGVYAVYFLEEGKIYEVKDNKSRWFCTVRDWEIVKLTKEEADECLKDRSESTS